jgi:hypothetical protein
MTMTMTADDGGGDDIYGEFANQSKVEATMMIDDDDDDEASLDGRLLQDVSPRHSFDQSSA